MAKGGGGRGLIWATAEDLARNRPVVLSVGVTTFGPVAEGARRQNVRNNEADVKSKRGDGPSSWIFGSEDEDT